MDRIKRLSYEVLDENKSQFGVDFADNKKILNQISIIRSKTLKNKIAGYITKFIKKEIREEKIKQDRIIASKFEQPTESEIQTIMPDTTSETHSELPVESEETPIKIVEQTGNVEDKSDTIEEKTQ
jgi:small subunit ribosomal protein S17e